MVSLTDMTNKLSMSMMMYHHLPALSTLSGMHGSVGRECCMANIDFWSLDKCPYLSMVSDDVGVLLRYLTLHAG